jgi:hypothetical protein
MRLAARLLTPFFFFYYKITSYSGIGHIARHSRALSSVVISGRTSSNVKASTLDNAALAFSKSIAF